MRRAGQSRGIFRRGTPNVRGDLASTGARQKTAQPTNDAGSAANKGSPGF